MRGGVEDEFTEYTNDALNGGDVLEHSVAVRGVLLFLWDHDTDDELEGLRSRCMWTKFFPHYVAG